MKSNSLNFWLDDIRKLHPKSIDLELTRITQVAEKLELIHFSCPVILVGGTNGKGSCIALLEAIYLSAGFRVGSFISPELLHFQDQVRLQGFECEEEALIEAFIAIEAARDGTSLTEFEFTTLAALYVFKQENLDVILLEIGLGGRFDAVNVVEPTLSILTNISEDHQNYLGNTREEIAYHKSGIFRANKPAIFGEENIPEAIFREAKNLSSRLYCSGRDFNYRARGGDWTWFFEEIPTYCLLPQPQLDLSIASIALMAVYLLQEELPVSENARYQGLSTARLEGRFQVKEGERIVVYDVAHNPAAMENLVHKLQNYFSKDQKFHFVLGMFADKPIKKSLDILCSVAKDWYIGGLDSPRSETPTAIGQILKDFGQNGVSIYPTIQEAYRSCLKQSEKEDVIVVTGSFFAVAPLLKEEQSV